MHQFASFFERIMNEAFLSICHFINYNNTFKVNV